VQRSRRRSGCSPRCSLGSRSAAPRRGSSNGIKFRLFKVSQAVPQERGSGNPNSRFLACARRGGFQRCCQCSGEGGPIWRWLACCTLAYFFGAPSPSSTGGSEPLFLSSSEEVIDALLRGGRISSGPPRASPTSTSEVFAPTLLPRPPGALVNRPFGPCNSGHVATMMVRRAEPIGPKRGEG
jgi:hypothetical protein